MVFTLNAECEDVEVIGLIDPNLNSLKTLFSSLDTVNYLFTYFENKKVWNLSPDGQLVYLDEI